MWFVVVDAVQAKLIPIRFSTINAFALWLEALAYDVHLIEERPYAMLFKVHLGVSRQQVRCPSSLGLVIVVHPLTLVLFMPTLVITTGFVVLFPMFLAPLALILSVVARMRLAPLAHIFFSVRTHNFLFANSRSLL